jgi:hypothetical protein
MVPGSPVGLLACRYIGTGPFAAAATFAPTPIATALNRAKIFVLAPNEGCTVELSDSIVLRFVYANARTLTVNVETFGCRVASNGDRVVFTPQSVLSALEATLGHGFLPGKPTP